MGIPFTESFGSEKGDKGTSTANCFSLSSSVVLCLNQRDPQVYQVHGDREKAQRRDFSLCAALIKHHDGVFIYFV